jgi:hypothetical protein
MAKKSPQKSSRRGQKREGGSNKQPPSKSTNKESFSSGNDDRKLPAKKKRKTDMSSTQIEDGDKITTILPYIWLNGVKYVPEKPKSGSEKSGKMRPSREKHN